MNVEDRMLPAEVFMVLYNRAKTHGMGVLNYNPKPMTLAEAETITGAMIDAKRTYVDYFGGRIMKIDFAPKVGQDLDTFLYNRDNGHNAAEDALMDYMTAPEKAAQ